MRNKQILLSGRAAVTNAANVPADRYSFLHLSDAEPSLGIAQEDEFVLVYDTNSPGQRLWSKKLITAYQHANNAYESQNTTGIYANAAFLKANSAYESQNVTGTYANNAYLHANSAYQSQNTTGEYANSAFLKANSAYESQNVTGTYANNAYLHANSAYESQNVTGTYANNAYLHANSAYQSQNTTGDYANSAFLKANSAYESQNVTGTYANNAYLHANSAYDSQNTTGVYANASFLKANSAYESQNVTGTYANNAYLHANSAYQSQNTTGTYANSAFLKANSAYESQNVTGTYANNAYLHANSAFDKANSAYESQNVTGIYANTSFEYANSAGQYANASFDYANSAYTHSNAAFIFANTRYSANGGEISGDVLITGNLIIQGTQFITQTDTLAIHDNMIYLNNAIAANVINAVGNGTHVIYTTEIAHGYDVGMGISISGITPNSFNISGTSNTLIGAVTTNTFTVISSVTDTYISGGTARGRTSLNPDIGFAGGYYSGSYAHAGLFRDATDDTWKFFHNYTPEPDVSPYIDTNHPSFSIANLTANLITDVISLRGYDPLDASNAAYQHANSAYESQNTTGTYANAAFIHANAANLQANSAYESQNVTGTYANNAYTNSNAAFLQANSAYESQNVTGTYANNAYLHANSAYESQNVTGTYANNAYLHANSSYESQNVTGTYANNAYLHANSAYESQNVTGTYANNAYIHANSSYESQNTTGVYANASFLKANSAYESQNVTGTYANNAYLHANSAYGSQNTTGVYANAAYLHANSAYGSQNTTGIYANASFLKVNAAYQHANSAYDSQNTTGLYANAAFEKANAAVFTITANTDQIYTNVATGNVRIGLANVNTNIGTFGGQEAIPVINVDGYGRITSIANTTITVPPGTYIFPNTNQLTANANSGNILIGLANVNNDIGTFGGTEAIPVFEVDGFGRIVSVSNTTITVPPGTYIFSNTNQLTANANSGNVLIGLYAIANNVGTFGSEFAVPTITVDTFGRVTDIVNTTISIPQGTYIVNSNLITSNSASGNVVLGLAESGVTPGTYGGAGQTPVITVDEYGRITFGANVESAVNTLSTIIRNTYTATSGQTGFNTTGTFTPGYADVYVNGIKLSPADYVANPAGSVNIVNPTLLDGDVVDIQTATTFIVDASSLYEKQTFVATAGQTSVNFSYTVGEISVYLNGLRLKSGDDYTAVNGTSITFPIALELDDVVEVEKISRSVVKVVNPYMGTRETFVASANGENTFTPVGGYRIGFVDIFLNGIKLNIGNDVVANNGTDFTIVSPTIEEDDVIEIVGSAAEFSFANALPITGGTIYGNLSLTGNLTSSSSVNAVTFNATSNVNSANVVTTTLRTTDAFVSGNVTVTSNVVANAVNVATVYFNDGTQMTTAASGSGSGITWKIATANTTANSGEGILVNTLSANVHITLPASPELGNTVRIVDMTGNFGINNCIIERNGQVIMGLADRLVISTNNAGIGLVFSDATHGWRIIENP